METLKTLYEKTVGHALRSVCGHVTDVRSVGESDASYTATNAKEQTVESATNKDRASIGEP